jgi:hypothetical protein
VLEDQADVAPAASCASGRAVSSRPATITLPALGRFKRLMVRTSELLPAPLRPMMPNTSPGAIFRSMPRSASWAP